MVLVDTSVWVNHLRKGNTRLRELLGRGLVFCHPFVVGELACGHLKHRQRVLSLLKALPSAPRAEDDEVLQFIEKRALTGVGLGLVDVHLLASAILSDAVLWTEDRRLKAAANRLGIGYDP